MAYGVAWGWITGCPAVIALSPAEKDMIGVNYAATYVPWPPTEED